jgi:cytochrome c-type biogenesis protein CcmH/NrfG
MLFEKIRRTQKPVFIVLAVTFGLGFVLLGVGSGTGGVNPLDIFGNNSSSAGSIADLNSKVRENPKNSTAWLDLAQAYAADGQLDPAIGAYQQYLQLKPNDVRAVASAATLYETRAQRTRAQGQGYQTALQALQSQQSALGMTNLKLSSQFSEPLLSSLQTPLQTKATDFQTRISSDLKQATGLWKQATGIESTNPIYWKALANDAIQTQDYKTALDALQQYLKVSPLAGDAAEIKKIIKQLKPLAGAVTTTGQG